MSVGCIPEEDPKAAYTYLAGHVHGCNFYLTGIITARRYGNYFYHGKLIVVDLIHVISGS